MNSLKTLYFPATDIYSIRQYPIFLLSQDVLILQPVEGDPGSENADSDIFIKSGFCQVDTPIPLGQDRDRFLRLVKDIETRKDDYAAQLSSLTLAAMSNPANKEENSERAIINQLFTPNDLGEQEEEQDREAQLWQVRLVLAIAEILDREEEEIAANLAILDDETADLYKELQGDSDDLEDDSLRDALYQIEQKLGHSNSKTMKKRLLAWQTLFQQSSSTGIDIFLTTSRDAGDFLINGYEKKSNQPALLLSGLVLPGLLAKEGKLAHKLVTDFTSDNEALYRSLSNELQSLCSTTKIADNWEAVQKNFTVFAEQWNERIEEVFAEKEFGRTDLTICVFPEHSCQTLLETEERNGPVNGVVMIAD